jgi:hypothetical protein
MLEALRTFLASLFEILLNLLGPLLELFAAIFSIDRSLGENSRMGESPLAEEGRRSWRNCAVGCLVLILLGAVVAALAWLWLT